MALDGNRLGTAIANAIKSSVPPAGSQVSDAQLEAMWQLVGVEIVNEIKNNGVVSTTVTTPDTIDGTGSGSMS